MTGAYVVSDLLDYRSPEGSLDFGAKVLGITKGDGEKTAFGRVITSGAAGAPLSVLSVPYSHTLNSRQYIVENPDILEPSGKIHAATFLTFSDTSLPAGILTKNGKSNGAVMSIPFEAIEDQTIRNQIMKGLLDYLEN